MENGQIMHEIEDIKKKMITKKEVESLIETIDIMGNPDTMRQIAESMEEIKQGKVKEINSVKDMLDEM